MPVVEGLALRFFDDGEWLEGVIEKVNADREGNTLLLSLADGTARTVPVDDPCIDWGDERVVSHVGAHPDDALEESVAEESALHARQESFVRGFAFGGHPTDTVTGPHSPAARSHSYAGEGGGVPVAGSGQPMGSLLSIGGYGSSEEFGSEVMSASRLSPARARNGPSSRSLAPLPTMSLTAASNYGYGLRLGEVGEEGALVDADPSRGYSSTVDGSRSSRAPPGPVVFPSVYEGGFVRPYTAAEELASWVLREAEAQEGLQRGPGLLSGMVRAVRGLEGVAVRAAGSGRAADRVCVRLCLLQSDSQVETGDSPPKRPRAGAGGGGTPAKGSPSKGVRPAAAAPAQGVRPALRVNPSTARRTPVFRTSSCAVDRTGCVEWGVEVQEDREGKEGEGEQAFVCTLGSGAYPSSSPIAAALDWPFLRGYLLVQLFHERTVGGEEHGPGPLQSVLLAHGVLRVCDVFAAAAMPAGSQQRFLLRIWLPLEPTELPRRGVQVAAPTVLLDVTLTLPPGMFLPPNALHSLAAVQPEAPATTPARRTAAASRPRTAAPPTTPRASGSLPPPPRSPFEAGSPAQRRLVMPPAATPTRPAATPHRRTFDEAASPYARRPVRAHVVTSTLTAARREAGEAKEERGDGGAEAGGGAPLDARAKAARALGAVRDQIAALQNEMEQLLPIARGAAQQISPPPSPPGVRR
jgi:hypothetical protein